MSNFEHFPHSTTLVTAIFISLHVVLSGCDLVGDRVDSTRHLADEQGSEIKFTPAVSNDRLIFDSYEEFRILMNEVVNNDMRNIDEFEARLQPTFVSLRTVAERLSDSLAVYEDYEFIEDPFVASILNQQGEVQIADTVFKVTRNFVYHTRAAIASALGEIQSDILLSAGAEHTIPTHIDGVNVFTIQRASDLSDDQASNQGVPVAPAWGNKGDCQVRLARLPNENRRRRMKAGSWIVDFFFYHSAGIELETQKKVFLRWKRTAMHTIEVDSEAILVTKILIGRVVYDVDTTYNPFYALKADASEIRHVYSWWAGIPLVDLLDWIDPAFHGLLAEDFASVSKRMSISTDFRTTRRNGASYACSASISKKVPIRPGN